MQAPAAMTTSDVPSEADSRLRGRSGLDVCRELVEAHRGRITVASSGGTTTFPFGLPLAHDAESAQGSVVDRIGCGQEWRNLMNQSNYTVAIYDTHTFAEEAIKLLRAERFDMKQMSIIGKDYHTEEHPIGFYNIGDRMKFWGKLGAFWVGSGGGSSAPASFSSRALVMSSCSDRSSAGSPGPSRERRWVPAPVCSEPRSSAPACPRTRSSSTRRRSAQASSSSWFMGRSQRWIALAPCSVAKARRTSVPILRRRAESVSLRECDRHGNRECNGDWSGG